MFWASSVLYQFIQYLALITIFFHSVTSMKHINVFNSFSFNYNSPKTHRNYREFEERPFLSKRDSHKDRAQQREQKQSTTSEASTPQLLRKKISIQFKSKSTIKKDELFILLKGKNITVSHSQSKQKNIGVEKLISKKNDDEKQQLTHSFRMHSTFSNQKWRFKHQKQIMRLNEQADKLRKEKEKKFLNKKPLLKGYLGIERAQFLRF